MPKARSASLLHQLQIVFNSAHFCEILQDLRRELRSTARLLQLPLVRMRTLLLIYLSDSDHLLPQITRCFSFTRCFCFSS
jgi:hypothetical protein